MNDTTDLLRGVLIATRGARLLLPNATIAEVLSIASPDPVAGAPDWLLGRIRWRGWQVPLIAFARLAGLSTDEAAGLGTKLVVLKAIGENPRLPYVAMLTQGFPRLVSVTRQSVVPETTSDPLPPYVHGQVRLNEDVAWVPHLEMIESTIAAAMQEAAHAQAA